MTLQRFLTATAGSRQELSQADTHARPRRPNQPPKRVSRLVQAQNGESARFDDISREASAVYRGIGGEHPPRELYTGWHAQSVAMGVVT